MKRKPKKEIVSAPTEKRAKHISKILQILKRTASRSTSELFDKCTTTEWREIVHIPGYHELIRASIELFTKELIDLQRADMVKFAFDLITVEKICALQQREFKTIFDLNNIDIQEFCKSVISVLNKTEFKKNTLRLVGVPNSCKTLIANCICEPFICCYNNNHGSENEFYLSNMLNKSIVLCEELYITIATCEDFKSILGGQVIDIAKKYNEKQMLCRTPMVITTNHKLFGRGHLGGVDESALRIRCYNYNFISAYTPIIKLDSANFYHFIMTNVY